MSSKDYESSLKIAIRQLRNDLIGLYETSDHTDVFDEFLNEGEFTLALEDITGRLLEQGVSVKIGVYKRIESLAEQLKIDPSNWKAIQVD